jgi:hypothetical protein
MKNFFAEPLIEIQLNLRAGGRGKKFKNMQNYDLRDFCSEETAMLSAAVMNMRRVSDLLKYCKGHHF